MVEYIEREAMKQALRNAHIHINEDGIVIEIDDIPAADVQPVKHGRWKQRKETLGRGPMYAEIYVWECTACKSITPVDVDKYYYCPVCGTKMDGEP